MKIALVIYGSLDTLSGGYLYDRKLVGELRAAGCTVDIISLPWRNYAAHLTDNVGGAWRNHLFTGDYDLILQDELNHPSLFLYNRVLRRRVQSPLVAIVHHLRSEEDHPPLLRRIYDLIETAYLRSVDGFIFNSVTSRRVVTARRPTPAPSIIAYPAADHIAPPTTAAIHHRIQERRHNNGPLRCLFVGNLSPRKALHTVLDALARLPAHSWQLDVVGSITVDSAYAQSVMRRAYHSFAPGAVTWHGRVNDDELRACYLNADLFVAPSYEGFGIVYLEAMAFGLPVIASTAGAAHEIVTPHQNGYLVPPDDSAGLATRLDELRNNRTQWAEMAVAARARYESHGTWQSNFAPAIIWLREITKR